MDAYIIDAIRTPIASFRGSLSPVRADDLAALTIEELMKRNKEVAPEAIEDVLFGCANQAGEDNRNVARMALLLAGLPQSVPGETINRLCSSSMATAIHASRAIRLGEGDLFISGGVEHMTRGPYAISKASKPFGNDSKIYDTSFGWRFVNPRMEEIYGTHSMGETAENVAQRYDVKRADQDKFAIWSQSKAKKAQGTGRFDREIVSVEIPQRKADPIVFDKDEFLKPDTTEEKLAKLRPAFAKEGTVTAGNASGLNDGAGAMLIASGESAEKRGLKPKARILSSGVVGVEPAIMGIGPVEASNKALKRAGLTIDDMDIIEINEAFAAQSLACIREWGLSDDDSRINPNGGAISLGHPLGMSGTRILQTATEELVEQQKKYALVTMCVGVGQGYATVLEKA